MNFRVKICNYIQIYTKVHIIVYNSALADSGALNAPSVVTHIRWIKDEQAFFRRCQLVISRNLPFVGQSL